MVKARITVFDDETGEIICRDQVIAPSREEHGTRMGVDGPPVDEYYFMFVLKQISKEWKMGRLYES